MGPCRVTPTRRNKGDKYCYGINLRIECSEEKKNTRQENEYNKKINAAENCLHITNINDRG